jgi:hypothetical protein
LKVGRIEDISGQTSEIRKLRWKSGIREAEEVGGCTEVAEGRGLSVKE